jgi:hypothetical protein
MTAAWLLREREPEYPFGPLGRRRGPKPGSGKTGILRKARGYQAALGKYHAPLTLQSVADYPGSHPHDLADISGLDYPTIVYSLQFLRQAEYVAKVGASYSATERGKIALAIHLGKMHRAASRRRARAA